MSAASSVKVFIVDDAPSIRTRITELLSEIEGMVIVGEAETSHDAIAAIMRLRPHFVVLDYQLVGSTAVDVLRAVCPLAPEVVFLILTNHPSPQYRLVCLEAGAKFYFDKSTQFKEIRRVIAASRAGPRQQHNG
jgi:two-component system response regulator DevR